MAFEAAHKRVRSQGKLARRQWLEARIDEANQAAQHHDQAEVYRMVNTLAPRKPRTSVYIKSPEGHLLSGADQFQAIYDYYSKAFSSPQDFVCPQDSARSR